jgi:hypothetical protein
MRTRAAWMLAGLLGSGLLWPGLGAAQGTPAACPAASPERVAGQVVKVDAAAGRLTVRAAGGAIADFVATPDLARDLEPGDQIDARLRPASKC